MAEDASLQDLYAQLGNLQLEETQVEGVDLDGTDPTATGISTFRKISVDLQKEACGSNSELQKVAGDAGLTEDKVKTFLEGVVTTVLKLGGSWPVVIATIACDLFFDLAAPEICKKWAAWNADPASSPYQANPAITDPSIFAHH